MAINQCAGQGLNPADMDAPGSTREEEGGANTDQLAVTVRGRGGASGGLSTDL